MHKVSIFFTASIIYIISQSIALACSCPSPTPTAIDAWKKADIVISGTAAYIREITYNNIELTTFSVKKSWKGSASLGTTIHIASDLDDWTCDHNFSLKKSYLIFATKSKKDNQLHVSTCTPSSLLENASFTIKNLGTPEDIHNMQNQQNTNRYGTSPTGKKDHLKEYRSLMNPDPQNREFYYPFSIK